MSKLIDRLMALRGELATVAQKVYDEWDASDPEFGDPEVGFGGICQNIAEALADAMQQHGFDIRIFDAQMGEQHVWTGVRHGDEAYHVDIPPGTYETGGGYNWKKIPGVTFTPDDIVIDPADLDQFDEEY